MKKRRELDALMKLGRNGSANGSPFSKDSSSLLIVNSQSSTEEEEEEIQTSNTQRSRRNGTVVGTKQNNANSACSGSFLCSVFIFSASFLLCIYLFWSLLSMQHKYDDIANRLLKLESDVNTNLDALSQLTKAMQPIKDQIGNLSEKSNFMSKSMSEVKTELPTLREKLDGLSEVSSIQDKFDEFKASLASNINSIETKITNLESSQNEESISEWKLQQESSIAGTQKLVNNLQLNLTGRLNKTDLIIRQLQILLSNNVSDISRKFKNISSTIGILSNEVKDLTSSQVSIAQRVDSLKRDSSSSGDYSNTGEGSQIKEKKVSEDDKSSSSSELNHNYVTAGATPHSTSTNTTTTASDLSAKKPPEPLKEP